LPGGYPALIGRNHLPLGRLRVVGDSMVPTLLPGDRVLVWRGLGPLRPPIRIGDLVAVVDPRDPDTRGSGGVPRERLMVKRVAGVAGAEIIVRGDNEAASTDSRHFGPVSAAAVRGRVIYRYLPEERRGPLGTRR
jgi:nickel-type superoxide dismutase maturation protease